MLTISRVLDAITQMKVTHVVWVPDSLFGQWETALEQSQTKLVRVCREGEAWPLAAGLYAGGATPLVIMQSTGFFESGDALRNVVWDMKCPVYAWIGIRNWLNPTSTDSARRFALPMIEAWQIDHVWVNSDDDLATMCHHYERCQQTQSAGLALIAEGTG
ncbi:MAG: hypothetical protein FJ267_12130 [Planctomycetes bacterium]|nr:hypothetical protein [Planctomycetota bacterium]